MLCSDSARTRETLDIILSKLKPAPTVLYETALYLTDAKKLLQRLQKVPDEFERVLLVGHNPGLQELVTLLVDSPAGPLIGRATQDFPTAALARFDVPVPWAALEPHSAHLTALIAPKT